MSRFAFVSLLALAACVGDAPSSKPSTQDAGTSPDSGTPTIDSGSESDAGTPSNDTGTDAGPPCVAPAANMISWWRGEDNFGDVLSSNPMSPTPNAGNVGFAPGHVGKSLSFDGTKFLERPLPLGIANLGSFTVEAWVKATVQADHRILDRSTAGSSDGWYFDIWKTKLRFAILTATVESKMVMPIGTLVHVAGTFDGSTLRVFVNGLEDNQGSSGGVTTLPAPDHPLRIGGASDFSARWNGLIDEPSIYSRALAPAEIKAIYEAGSAGRCK